MSLFDELGDLLKRVTTGNAPESEVHEAYDQLARAVPSGTIAEGLSHAFRSDQTPPFEQMVSNLFHRSDANQKAGLINHLLGALGAGGFSQALRGVLGGNGPQIVPSGGNLTPQMAEQLSPEAVQVLAQEAVQKDPSIIDQAASFYAEHPMLVKTLGAAALALLLSRISSRR